MSLIVQRERAVAQRARTAATAFLALVACNCAAEPAAGSHDQVVTGDAGLDTPRTVVPPPVVLPNTEQRTFESSSNGIDYKLYVALPAGYDTSQVSYPVVYLLDADYSFAISRNIVEHLADRGDLPHAISVGIAYAGPRRYRLNRTRDYTPTRVATGGYGPQYQAASGGGPPFRRFIREELIPFIEGEYRASDTRVLVGHSYGGLFGAWMLLNERDLFDGYVIVSPSLWYDDKYLFDLERRHAELGKDLPARVYLTVGSRERNGAHDMVGDLSRFAQSLEERGYPGLRLRWDIGEDETHNSIFPGALSDGLRFVLGGY